MKRLERLWPYAILPIVCVLGLLFVRHQPSPENLLNWEISPQDRPEDLERQLQAVVHRTAAKRRIAREVIGEKLTLLEAAGRFMDLNEANPDFNWQALRDAYPAGSDEESCCRQVIRFVAGQLLDEPDRAKTVQQRLEAELQYHLQQGTLHLRQPDPGPRSHASALRQAQPQENLP